MVQLAARGTHAGEGAAEQELEATSTYYVDLTSDDEEGVTVEAMVDSILRDLELLFQEQLTALAEDAAEQQAVKKGKVVVTDPSQQEDHLSIMVLEEEAATAPTRPDELNAPQSGGGSRWFIQHMPRSSSAAGDSTQISLPEDSFQSDIPPASTSRNEKEDIAAATAVAAPVVTATVAQAEEPSKSTSPEATRA